MAATGGAKDGSAGGITRAVSRAEVSTRTGGRGLMLFSVMYPMN